MRMGTSSRWDVLGRRAAAVALAGVLAAGMAGCSAGTEPSASTGSPSSHGQSSHAAEGQSASASVAYAAEIDESPYDLEYTRRDGDPSYDAATAVAVMLTGPTAEATGPGVSVDGSTVTIGAEGVYVLSGTLDDGQVVVNAPEDAKVQLVLDGASVTNSDAPAILVQQADKCFVTLAEGSENSIADGAEYADSEADANAALYSTCDLTLQGSGQLSVSANFNDAVKTKDDLTVTGGAYAVKAAGDALVGHDSVKVSGGTFAIDAGNDAVKSSKDDDDSKGFVSIDGGTFAINAADKGMNAETYLRVSDGAVLDITAGDDALHSNNYARIAGGDIAIKSGDDAVHADYVLAVDGGTVDVAECVEGYEAQVITVNGSTTHIVSSDDGMNASTGGTASGGSSAEGDIGAGGRMPEGEAQGDGVEPGTPTDGDGPDPSGQVPGDEGREGLPPDGGNAEPGDSGQGGDPGAGSGKAERRGPHGDKGGLDGQGRDGSGSEERQLPRGGQGGMGGDPMADADENCILTINGGSITIEAEGDGVDSNGYLYVNGGETFVSGPTSSGDGSVDYGLGAEITGGTFIAAGSSGMAESFTGGTQAFALVSASGSAGDAVVVKDAGGAVLGEFTPTKAFQCVVVSMPGMSDGEEYALSVNGSETSFTASTEASQDALDGRGWPGNGGMGGPQGGQGGPQGRLSESQSTSA